MNTKKEMRQEVMDYVATTPGAEIAPGVIVKTVGYKWVTLLDTRDSDTTKDRIEISEFYAQHAHKIR